MANIAKEIIKENGFGDQITVVPKSSMDLSVPQGFLSYSQFSFNKYLVKAITNIYLSTQFKTLFERLNFGQTKTHKKRKVYSFKQ